jgi:hypothetical protein
VLLCRRGFQVAAAVAVAEPAAISPPPVRVVERVVERMVGPVVGPAAMPTVVRAEVLVAATTAATAEAGERMAVAVVEGERHPLLRRWTSSLLSSPSHRSARVGARWPTSGRRIVRRAW